MHPTGGSGNAFDGRRTPNNVLADSQPPQTGDVTDEQSLSLSSTRREGRTRLFVLTRSTPTATAPTTRSPPTMAPTTLTATRSPPNPTMVRSPPLHHQVVALAEAGLTQLPTAVRVRQACLRAGVQAVDVIVEALTCIRSAVSLRRNTDRRRRQQPAVVWLARRCRAGR